MEWSIIKWFYACICLVYTQVEEKKTKLKYYNRIKINNGISWRRKHPDLGQNIRIHNVSLVLYPIYFFFTNLLRSAREDDLKKKNGNKLCVWDWDDKNNSNSKGNEKKAAKKKQYTTNT